MPTVITSTLKPSGGDYTTIAAWLSANGGATSQDLVANDEAIVLECYSGDYTGIASGGDGYIGEAISPSGWTTDATRNITIRAAPGHRHNGIPGQGFEWRNTNNFTSPLTLSNDVSWHLEWIHFNQFTNVDYRQALVCGTETIVTGCIFQQSGTGAADCVQQGARDSFFYLCLFIGNGTNTAKAVETANFTNASYYNCAFIDCDAGIDSNTNSVAYEDVLVNCYAFNCDEFTFSGNTQYIKDSSHNASSLPNDNTPGSNVFLGAIGADNFVNAANKDFRLTENSHLIAAGSDVSERFSQDVTGAVIRTDAWPIGPFFRLPSPEQGACTSDPRLLAPELLIPSRKPTKRCVVDWQHPLTAGLSFFYPMIGNALLEDAAGLNPPIDISGGAEPSLNEIGHCLYFDNTSHALIDNRNVIGYGGSLDEFTALVIFKHASAADNMVMSLYTGAQDLWLPYVFGDGTTQEFRSQGSSNNVRFGTSEGFSMSQPFIACMSIEQVGGSSDLLRAYVRQGTEIYRSSQTAPLTSVTPGTGSDFILGADADAINNGSLGNYMDGYIYGVAFWKRRLSNGEMESMIKNPYQFLVPA